MNEETLARQTTHRTSKRDIDESDRLISRIVDGEANDADRQRFAALASEHPELWRELARQQKQMAILAERVGSLLDHAERVEPGSGDRGDQSMMSGSQQV